MKNWENLRLFLAVARTGSFSAAARQLHVDHSTISRRINALEKKLGVRLFERLSTGYVTTIAGEEMFDSAKRIEDEFAALEKRVRGRDTRLSGVIRVTASDAIITKLLVPYLPAFLDQYPHIELHLIASTELMNLNKREVDVAIRVTNLPPENLVGRKFFRLVHAIYASVGYLARYPDAKAGDAPLVTRLDQDADRGIPRWQIINFPESKVKSRINLPLVLLEAVKAGMGMAHMACFMGDTEPDLRRVPGAVADTGLELWLLTHRDIRTTARVRVFNEFVTGVINRQRDLIEGRCPIVGGDR